MVHMPVFEKREEGHIGKGLATKAGKRNCYPYARCGRSQILADFYGGKTVNSAEVGLKDATATLTFWVVQGLHKELKGDQAKTTFHSHLSWWQEGRQRGQLGRTVGSPDRLRIRRR